MKKCTLKLAILIATGCCYPVWQAFRWDWWPNRSLPLKYQSINEQ